MVEEIFMTKSRKALWFSALILVLFFIVTMGIVWRVYMQDNSFADQKIGVNFSVSKATALGLDWQQVYVSMLDDWGVRNFRLSADWPEIQKIESDWDFTTLDWFLAEADKRGAQVIIALGQRSVHWYECQIPLWLEGKSESWRHDKEVAMIKKVVMRYHSNPALKAWQLQDAPLRSGNKNCPAQNLDILRSEQALIKTYDNQHPVIVSDKATAWSWFATTKIADSLALTFSSDMTEQSFFQPSLNKGSAWQYGLKALLSKKKVSQLIISDLPIDSELVVSADQQATNAKKFGFAEIYLSDLEKCFVAENFDKDDSFYLIAKKIFNHN